MDPVDYISNSGAIKPGRIGWLDTLKGIGIFLVFFGHLHLLDTNVTKYIFSFHMPLFFLISGSFFKNVYVEEGFSKFFKHKLYTRMVPYVSFGILTYCIWLAQMMLRKYGVYTGSHPFPNSLIRPIIGMLYGNDINRWLIHDGLLWFLACLLVTEILFFAILYVSKNNNNITTISLISCAILGYLDSLYFPIRLPFSIDVAFTAVVFYGAGFLIKDKLIQYKIKIHYVLLCAAIGLISVHYNTRIDMNYNRYGNPILFYVSAFCNIYLFVYIAKNIHKIKNIIPAITYVGQSSLLFFLLQNQAFLAVDVLLYLILRIKGPVELNVFAGAGYALAAMIVLFPASFIANNYTPVILGKSTGSSTPKKSFIAAREADVVKER